MKIRTLLLLAALSLAAPTVQAAQATGGSRTAGFSCDVNTGYCECTGARDGADCKGMMPNCKVEEPPGTIWTSCTIGAGCKCRMFRVAPNTGQSKAPKPATRRAPR